MRLLLLACLLRSRMHMVTLTLVTLVRTWMRAGCDAWSDSSTRVKSASYPGSPQGRERGPGDKLSRWVRQNLDLFVIFKIHAHVLWVGMSETNAWTGDCGTGRSLWCRSIPLKPHLLQKVVFGKYLVILVVMYERHHI